MIKMLSLFSGIGAFEKALTNLGINFELVGFSEIDKYAITSYCAVHNVDESLNLGDVSKVETHSIPDFDLMTCGFPCTDVSISGKMQGLSEGSGTRSSLLWEAMKIVEVKKPKYMIAENVKNLLGKKFKEDFDKWLNQLNELGYNTYYQVLNAKDFGIPQNRERVFIVSILKDIDNGEFEFPIGRDYGIRLKDILEKEVDEKYYISPEKTEKLLKNIYDKISDIGMLDTSQIVREGKPRVYNDYSCTLTARDYKEPRYIYQQPKIIELGKMNENRHSSLANSVLDANGICPTLDTMSGGNRQPKIIDVIPSAIRGRYNENNKIEQQLELKPDGITNTLTTVQKDNVIIETPQFRIRKLMPLECWILMGFTKEDFTAAKEKLNNTYYKGKNRSDSQLYKQAGNSIVVNVAESLLRNLFKTNILTYDIVNDYINQEDQENTYPNKNDLHKEA